MSGQLKPCPFCGGTELSVRKDYSEDNPSQWIAMHVRCEECFARGRNNYPIGWCENEQMAAEAWNDRPPKDAEIAKSVEKERLRFEGDLDKWMKIIGAGITGYQPEAYAVMDHACGELVRARAEIKRLTAERDGWQSIVGQIAASLPLKHVIGATGSVGDLVTYIKSSLSSLDERTAEVARLRDGSFKPFSTYPEDREKLLSLSSTIETNDSDSEAFADAADRLADLVRAILTDEASLTQEKSDA